MTGDKEFGNILRYPLGTHFGIVVARLPNEMPTATGNAVLLQGLDGTGRGRSCRQRGHHRAPQNENKATTEIAIPLALRPIGRNAVRMKTLPLIVVLGGLNLALLIYSQRVLLASNLALRQQRVVSTN